MSEPFAICPISVLLDRRLTFIQTRVLLALRTFWNHKRPHDPVFPTVRKLSERCGHDDRAVRRAIIRLCELGYLEKESGQGRQATRYWLLDPEVPEPSTLEGVESAPSEGVKTTRSEGVKSTRSEGVESTRTYITDHSNRPREHTLVGGNVVAPTNETQPAPKSKRRWRSVPDGEILTEDRLAFANREGLATTDARREWAKFCDYEFRTGKVSVDRTWRNWVRTAVERQGPAKQFKSADEKQRDVFARVRADLGIEGNQ